MSVSSLVRTAVPTDATAIQGIYAPMVERTAISFELKPPTIEEIGQRMESTLPRYPYRVAERDGEVAGYAYARPVHGLSWYGVGQPANQSSRMRLQPFLACAARPELRWNSFRTDPA
jgi:hypothetical protein